MSSQFLTNVNLLALWLLNVKAEIKCQAIFFLAWTYACVFDGRSPSGNSWNRLGFFTPVWEINALSRGLVLPSIASCISSPVLVNAPFLCAFAVAGEAKMSYTAVTESAYVNISVIGFCNTDTPIRFVDIAVPCNNESKHSLDDRIGCVGTIHFTHNCNTSPTTGRALARIKPEHSCSTPRFYHAVHDRLLGIFIIVLIFLEKIWSRYQTSCDWSPAWWWEWRVNIRMLQVDALRVRPLLWVVVQQSEETDKLLKNWYPVSIHNHSNGTLHQLSAVKLRIRLIGERKCSQPMGEVFWYLRCLKYNVHLRAETSNALPRRHKVYSSLSPNGAWK